MASDTTELKVAVQEGTSWSRRLSITVPAARVEQTRGRVAAQIASRARLPGFRKGKLPARVIEQRFGASIEQETIDRLIQETYREALESQGITPINQGKVDDIKYGKGEDLTFEVEVEVEPEIELSRLGGFTVERPEVKVGDDEVEAVLERLREERAEWAPIAEGARPDYGDQVLVEITALGEDDQPTEETRSYRIVLGENQAIPDVESAILTLAPGETGDFSVAFPDDFPDETRRGQAQRLRISVKEASSKVLPELDDEFAKGLGEFETMEALRERILHDVKEDAEERADAEVRRQLIDRVLEANPFDPPNSLVERYLDYMLQGPEGKQPVPAEEQEQYGKVRESIRPQAEWALKRTLVIERVAQAEGLRATQDEVDERIEEIATRHGRSPGEVWITLEKSGQLEELEREITESKVFGYLKAQNTIE